MPNRHKMRQIMEVQYLPEASCQFLNGSHWENMETVKLEIDHFLKGAVCKIRPDFKFKNIPKMNLYYQVWRNNSDGITSKTSMYCAAQISTDISVLTS